MIGQSSESDSRRSRLPLVCPPPRLSADTRAKQMADRLLPKGIAQWVYFAIVAAGVAIAPTLPLRPGLGLALAATVAASWWCLVNFWRCREAHCVVTGVGWAALATLEVVELSLGRSFLFGSEGLFFIAILILALAFEGLWRARHGTSALTRGAARR
ncbi:MAG: hypothetical protein WB807_07005 [Candidatus Dormiibacterota bacterium]